MCGCQCLSERESLTCKLQSLSLNTNSYFISGFSFTVDVTWRVGGGVRAKLVECRTPDSDTFIVEQMWIGRMCVWFVCRAMVVEWLPMCWCHVCAYTLTKPNCHLLSYGIAFCLGVLYCFFFFFDKIARWTNTVMGRSCCVVGHKFLRAYELVPVLKRYWIAYLLCEYSKEKKWSTKANGFFVVDYRTHSENPAHTHTWKPNSRDSMVRFLVEWHSCNNLLFCSHLM